MSDDRPVGVCGKRNAAIDEDRRCRVADYAVALNCEYLGER
jgi:hypothetical protein